MASLIRRVRAVRLVGYVGGVHGASVIEEAGGAGGYTKRFTNILFARTPLHAWSLSFPLADRTSRRQD